MNAIHWIAATVLAISLLFNWYQTNKIESFQNDISKLMLTVDSKQTVIDEQKKEILEMPKRYIETTRAIDQEICLGLNQIDKVMSMSAEYNTLDSPVTEVKKNEKDRIVNIDDKLPPDLIKLLNQD